MPIHDEANFSSSLCWHTHWEAFQAKLHKQAHWSHDTFEVFKSTKSYLLPSIFMFPSSAFSFTLQNTYFKSFCYLQIHQIPHHSVNGFLSPLQRMAEASRGKLPQFFASVLTLLFPFIRRYQLPRTNVSCSRSIHSALFLFIPSLFFLHYFFLLFYHPSKDNLNMLIFLLFYMKLYHFLM